jgi:hypothetical protein
VDEIRLDIELTARYLHSISKHRIKGIILNVPHIYIQRHEVGLYEWSLLYGSEKLEGDIGDSNIEGCLKGAMSSVPKTDQLVEISYRGIHMGTFRSSSLLENSQATSDLIVETYAKLID